MVWEICFSHEKKWQPVIDWADIERELERLDNEEHSYFNLSEDGVRYMKVYGGNQNRVVVEFMNVLLNDPYQILQDPTQTRSVMIAQWDGWDLPPEMCVDKALAKRALKHFYETQTPLESVTWGSWPLLWEIQINREREPVQEWAVIELAIDLMDNKGYAYVALGFENDTERAIEIYGGNQGRVHLMYTDQNEGFDAVLEDRMQKEPVKLFNGLYKQYLENLSPRHCVDKSLAKRALRYFFETQSLDPSLTWVDMYDKDI